jgi:hypothetical protein
MKGSDTGNVFRPTEAITKEQVVAMIIRILT